MRKWRVGLIGCGRFGRFCLENLRAEEHIELTAAADRSAALAEATAREFGMAASRDAAALLARADVDIALISTPPDTHFPLARAAIAAGKHVIVEKPLAICVREADELVEASRAAGVLLAVNHMLRYSGLLEQARAIIASGVLGEALCYFFENYAEDERLADDHWFWQEKRSGGIFIEHGVHFFDLYGWWFGPGKVVAAHAEARRGEKKVDRVWCALHHENGVLGRQYHGFDQPVRLDRADHRVVFARGELAIRGWIPQELSVRGIVSEEECARLGEIWEDSEVEIVERYEGEARRCRGRGEAYEVAAKVAMRRELAQEKGEIYGEMLRAFMRDQLRALTEPGHRPRVSAEEAREALKIAELARELARQGREA